MNTAPGIYVVIPAIEVADGPTSTKLEHELVTFAVQHLSSQCIMLPAPSDSQIPTWKQLIQNCHDQDITALLLDDDEHVETTGADGIHLPPATDIVGRYQHARTKLGPTAIIGTDAGSSRHDAMLLGEAGANYIAFGKAALGHGGGTDERNQLLTWWSTLFEIPCVAFDIATPAEAREAAESGAEFVTVTVNPVSDANEAARILTEYRTAINGGNE